jgi:hypothetical protein
VGDGRESHSDKVRRLRGAFWKVRRSRSKFVTKREETDGVVLEAEDIEGNDFGSRGGGGKRD